MAALAQTRTWFWRFEAADLKQADLVSDLAESICAECEVDAARQSDLALVIAEVINNAIDHGVLGLDSTQKKNPSGFEQYFISRAAKVASLRDGFVSVSVSQYKANTISLCVEDSGNGFDYPKGIQNLQPEFPCLSAYYGRGLFYYSSVV